MWDLPGPGLEPVSPALAGEFLTTAPPGKPLQFNFNLNINAMFQASEFWDLVNKPELLSTAFLVLYIGLIVAVKSLDYSGPL